MDGIEPTEVCARIKIARERARLSQPEMAKAIKCSVSSLNYYERDRVPLEKLGLIAKATSVDIRWLVFGDAYLDPMERIERRLGHLEGAARFLVGTARGRPDTELLAELTDETTRALLGLDGPPTDEADPSSDDAEGGQ
jgi:transcriptional regulator with XRE-family HTH domain